MRSVLGGEQYPLPLHSILSELDSNNYSDNNNNNREELDGGGHSSLRTEFAESLREAMGGEYSLTWLILLTFY